MGDGGRKEEKEKKIRALVVDSDVGKKQSFPKGKSELGGAETRDN